jgi:hypothetical protein
MPPFPRKRKSKALDARCGLAPRESEGDEDEVGGGKGQVILSHVLRVLVGKHLQLTSMVKMQDSKMNQDLNELPVIASETNELLALREEKKTG